MIHDESTPRQWRHVDNCANPADIASRRTKGSELHKLELWLHGPKFLWKDEKHWPDQPSQLQELPQDDSECRKCPGRANVIVRSKMLEPLLSRYSSWDSVRKAIAWLVRFKKHLVCLLNKDPDIIPKGPLTVREVIAAESVIVKAAQHNAFPAELAAVGQGASDKEKKLVLVNRLWPHSHQHESLRQIHHLPMWVWTISVPSLESKDAVR